MREEGVATRQQQQQSETNVTKELYLAGPSASNLKLQLKSPALAKCQQDLQDVLKPDDDLLDYLVSCGVINMEEQQAILLDSTILGSVKRLLIKVDEKGLQGVEALVAGLKQGRSGHKALAMLLEETLNEDSV